MTTDTQPGPGSQASIPALTPAAMPLNAKTDAVHDTNSSPPIYWPPLRPLALHLESLKFELATLPSLSDSSREFLDLYSEALRRGLGETFLKRGAAGAPTSTSSFLGQQKPVRTVRFPKYAVSSASSSMTGLISREGDMEVLVDVQMEEQAEEVSRCLDLDVRQSLYLVWMYQNIAHEYVGGRGSGGGLDATSNDNITETTTPYSLTGVCQLYCDERLSLLRALETILWIGEDPVAASEVRDYVESRLINGVLFAQPTDVEEVVLRDLKSGSGAHLKDAIAYRMVVMAKGNQGMFGQTLVPRPTFSLALVRLFCNEEDVNWAKVVVQGMEKERVKMLTLLSLVYYRPRKACGFSRFEELLELASTAAREGVVSSMHVLLLLEILVLEINGPLEDVASGGTGDSYPFLAHAERITGMIRALFLDAARAGKAEEQYVSVLALTWASILMVLVPSVEGGRSDMVRKSALALTEVCEQACSGELQHLILVSEEGSNSSKQMTQLSSLIVYHSVAIFMTAFNVDAQTDPNHARKTTTHQIVQILSKVLRQESVNDMVLYNRDDALNRPVLRFLSELDPMGVEQLKLLTAISCTYSGSVFALSYLRKITPIPHGAMLSSLRSYMDINDGPSVASASIILEFYDAVCSSNAVAVIEMLDSTDDLTESFISVLGLCVDKAPPSDESTILASAFRLMSYFVPYSPNNVMMQLMVNTGVSPVSFKLEFFDELMSTSSTSSGYQAVMAVFQLVSVLLQTAYGPKKQAIMLAMNMIRLSVPYISRMASSEEKWNLAAGCLTIVRHALMRSGTKELPDDIHQTRETGYFSGKLVSKKDVLELISPILPPECTTIANDVEHQGETEAIEKCVIKWLRLVPVLLSEGPAVYEYLFRSVNGRNAPAATLLSYLSYPYFGSEDKAAVVRSMAYLLGYDSNVPVTAFLPKNGPRLSLLQPCTVISDAINVDSPTHVESLFSAACDVLCNAVSYHPTLAVLLLPDLPSNSDLVSSASPPQPACSCTKHILSFAERASELYVSHPSRLEKVLDVICAAITSKKSRNGIMTSLIPNEKIWSAFMDILMRSAECDGGDDAQNGTIEGDEEVIDYNRFNVEMKVMDIFVAAMCSATGNATRESGRGCGDHLQDEKDLWRHVDLPIKKNFALVSTVLLRKYCGLIGRMSIGEEMLRVRRLAWLAGLQVMAYALDNGGLYASLRVEPSSLIANLWTCILRSKVPMPAQNPDRDSLIKLCQGLYDTFLRLEDAGSSMSGTLYKDPYLPMADLLLELRDGPLPMPNQIGSAWGKLIEDFALLETQTKRLNELVRLRCCLFECITSLGSFVAVCSDRYGWTASGSSGGGVDGARSQDNAENIADLDDIINVFKTAILDNWLLSQEILINDKTKSAIGAALVSSSKLAVLLSQRPDRYVVDERRLFELITLLVDNQGVWFVEESLADWLAVGINVAGAARSADSGAISDASHLNIDMMETPEREELHDVLPKLLPLTGASSSKVACTAASLVMTLMACRLRPVVWEEQVDSLNAAELLDSLVSGRGGQSAGDVTLRVKSLLLLVSQMISESDHVANVLISRGLSDAIVSVCHWVVDALPMAGVGGPLATADAMSMDRSHDEPTNREFLLDFAGRYTDTGVRYEVHTVWCIVLSLCSLLSSALPGHRKVETMLLRVSVSMADRIALSLLSPTEFASTSGGPQFMTLGYLEEARASLTFVCALARLEGEWLLNQPKMASQMRRLTAKFVQFAGRDVHNAAFAAISPDELRKNASAERVRTPVLFGADPVLQLTVTGEPAGEAAAEVTDLSLNMASHFYAMVKYALDFQLISAPEICEAETIRLGEKDTWVQVQALVDLCTTVASIMESLVDEDASALGSPRVKALAWRLTEICHNATALLARISPQPQLASTLCTGSAEKLLRRIEQ